MTNFLHLCICVILQVSFIGTAINYTFANTFAKSCNQDLYEIYDALQTHSAPAKHTADKTFHIWLENGYIKSQSLCSKVNREADIYDALKFYVDNFDDTHISLVKTAAFSKPEKKEIKLSENTTFGVKYLKEGVWIRIPTFSPNKQEAQEFYKIFSLLKNFRNKKFVVFDLTDNSGGNTNWERPLIRNFWGDKYLQSLGNKHSYNREWIKKLRVSKDNFEEFKLYHNSRENNEYQKLLKLQKDFYLEKWNIYDEQDNLYSNNDNTLVTVKVFVLTDRSCSSTCWLCVREMLELPGVTHIGEMTNIQTLYSQTRPIKLSSGHFIFYVPTQVRISPINHIGRAFIPTITYEGDFFDKASLHKWFFEKVLNSP